MRIAVAKSVLFCLSAVLVLSCTGSDTRTAKSAHVIHNLINTPLEFVNNSSEKIWEGDIGGKWVMYFRTGDKVKFKDVIVVTHDQLPGSYRSTEYCDDDGDNSLDQVNIRMYKQGEGWRDIIVNGTDRSTLNHANVQYKELIGEISYKRRGYLSVE